MDATDTAHVRAIVLEATRDRATVDDIALINSEILDLRRQLEQLRHSIDKAARALSHSVQ